MLVNAIEESYHFCGVKLCTISVERLQAVQQILHLNQVQQLTP